ncbi:protein kinase domain-containing protein [Tundrisphaera lichenicola]|uniref:serine/threonine-protein kinase n=1 Tax=Tundrisphaera lichenicola TaxID=2029860 RepID=UPI003EBD4B53
MGSIARSGTWDEASSPAATRLARRFEDAWRGSTRHRRPDPGDFLPEGPGATPAAWLALLRADLNLRWDSGETVRVEEYRDRHPDLDAETMVALCYEEFCRREEDGAAPFPAEYDERFPELADRLRRVFDIHELVGNAASTDLHVPGPEAVPFPEVGQTIAGFFLVEELGRGSFARVFLAKERQLADRPVALKVARTGSREPQTLARLQHTHIVPVHSYRIDPATDLHLLCMPYFGRVTLSRLLADPKARTAPTGAELLEVLDRLDPSEAKAGGSSARTTLAELPFARAIAWWGARLAEALGHAHDRGVLHRDIKPSNVLVTGDALPMLLDFNLAREPWDERNALATDHLGGTVAYMAPEHLEALSTSQGEIVDSRADIFSLGVLLYEALTGSRPFPAPSSASTVDEALHRAAQDRRASPPRLRDEHPEIPEALERVIRRCLEPDPARRFPNAAELAADLQAVAEDAPLRWTREPLTIRFVRRIRRSWKRLALVMAVTAGAATMLTWAIREEREGARIAEDAEALLIEGKDARARESFLIALAKFEEVARTTAPKAEMEDLHREARREHAVAREALQARAEADALSSMTDSLRFRLIRKDTPPAEVAPEIEQALSKFRVCSDDRWASDPKLAWLDTPRKSRLIRDVDEILFLQAVAIDPSSGPSAREGIRLCDRALAFTHAPGPWRALRARFDESPAPPISDDPRTESSALVAYEWAVLRDLEGRADSSTAWLDRATLLDPGRAWYHYHLATILVRSDRAKESIRHFEAAIAIEPNSKVFRIDRARAFRSIGEWARARDDEDRAALIGDR